MCDHSAYSLKPWISLCVQGAAFVIFPVQTITTVDSKVVQLGYQDGRLLVSSLSRCYLCDTEKYVFIYQFVTVHCGVAEVEEVIQWWK